MARVFSDDWCVWLLLLFFAFETRGGGAAVTLF